MHMWGRWIAVVAATCLGMGLSASAHAGESPFGWIYTADVHPPGTLEYEHHSFLQRGQVGGDYDYLINREELEYGVSNKFQLAGYFNWSYVNAYRNEPDGSTGGPGTDLGMNDNPFGRYRKTRFDSVSLEAIYQILNPLTDPIGLALYAEPTVGPDTRELELRLIVQKNFLDDRLILAGNLMAEIEREKTKTKLEKATMVDLVFGASYRFADRWSLGLEARNHREFEGYGLGNKEHSAWFIGPNLHYASQHWWITAAWRHQLPVVQAFTQDQRDVVDGDRIYGGEHARNEFMLKVGIPFGTPKR